MQTSPFSSIVLVAVFFIDELSQFNMRCRESNNQRCLELVKQGLKFCVHLLVGLFPQIDTMELVIIITVRGVIRQTQI